MINKKLILFFTVLSNLNLGAAQITQKTLKEDICNEFDIIVLKDSVHTLYVKGLVPGDLDCKIQSISPIEKILGEALFTDATGQDTRDQFILRVEDGRLKGRRFEKTIPYAYFDSPIDYTRGFFAFTNLSKTLDTKVQISCTLKKRVLPSLQNSIAESHNADNSSFFVFASDPLNNFLKNTFARMPEFRRRLEENLSERKQIFDEMLSQFVDIAEGYPAREEHYEAMRNFLLELDKIAYRNKIASKEKNLRETVLKTKEYFLRIIPSARAFLKDILEEVTGLNNPKERGLSWAERSLLEALEIEIINLQVTLKSIPLNIEVSNELLEETLQTQLATRLHSISQFIEKQRSKVLDSSQTQKFYQTLDRIFFHNLEIREHYILAMLNAVEINKLSSHTKKLIQGSVGIHPLIARDFMDQEGLTLDVDVRTNLEQEAYYYQHYMQPVFVELIPRNQWDRSKMMVAQFSYEHDAMANAIPMPTPSLLGKGLFRVYSQEIEAGSSVSPIKIPKKPAKKAATKVKPINNSVPIDSRRSEVNELVSPVEILEDNTSTPTVLESANQDKEEDFNWQESVEKNWAEEARKIHLGYCDTKGKQENEGGALKPDVHERRDNLLPYLELLNNKHELAFKKIMAQEAGVKWSKFKSICDKFGIRLRQPSKGSSHRTMHFNNRYLGTVWKPHMLKGGPRFGAGQTKLIQGYFEIWKGMISG